MNLIAAAIIGIAVIVLLIAACKVHPFLSLLAGSFVMAVCAGVPFDKAFDSFTSGVGGTISNVGLLIAFGSIDRHHPVQVGRCGHHRRHHHGQDTVAASAVGHGTDRVHRGHPDVLRGRRGHPHPGGAVRRPSFQVPCGAARHPGPRRPVHAARLRAAAPRSADRHRRAEREPRHHPGPRPDRGHPDRHHLRPAVRQARRQVGSDRSSGERG